MLTEPEAFGMRVQATAVAKKLSLNELRQIIIDTERAALSAGQTRDRDELMIMLGVYRSELARRTSS
jgi:hypothetical protein